MNTQDKLVFEDVTMAMAAYIHELAIELSPAVSRKLMIDHHWEEFKKRAAHLFSEWHHHDS